MKHTIETIKKYSREVLDTREDAVTIYLKYKASGVLWMGSRLRGNDTSSITA
jgi:hypothetical protein